jgi:hypothetical protein
MTQFSRDDTLKTLRPLLESLGLHGDIHVAHLEHRGNNRAYHVQIAGKELIAKFYFRDAGDPRDRLDTEYRFAEFAWRSGLRTVPEPFACDRVAGAAVYEFIAGRSLSPPEIDERAVEQAAQFYCSLNTPQRQSAASALPNASEACFSISEHIQRVQARVDRLSSIAVASPIDHDAVRFVAEQLAPLWCDVRQSLSSSALDDDLHSLRCLSPSDFGFHNAILEDRTGKLRFIDFEYAGWDDPAKLVCDFFCQPKLPAPQNLFPWFAEHIAETLPNPPEHVRRFNALMPAYRVKWCCIILNEFLPVGLKRRQFSLSESDGSASKQRQLTSAKETLEYARESL